MFIRDVHRTRERMIPARPSALVSFLRDLVSARTVRNFPADYLEYPWNECDEWAQGVSVYGRSSRLGRGEPSRRLPDLVPYFIPTSPGFRREGNYSRRRVCVRQYL